MVATDGSVKTKPSSVPFLLESFPTPPSHIPRAPSPSLNGTSGISRAPSPNFMRAASPNPSLMAMGRAASPNPTPISSPTISTTNTNYIRAPSPNPSITNSSPTSTNPPPSLPPSAPLPPLPGPSPLSSELFILARPPRASLQSTRESLHVVDGNDNDGSGDAMDVARSSSLRSTRNANTFPPKQYPTPRPSLSAVGGGVGVGIEEVRVLDGVGIGLSTSPEPITNSNFTAEPESIILSDDISNNAGIARQIPDVLRPSFSRKRVTGEGTVGAGLNLNIPVDSALRDPKPDGPDPNSEIPYLADADSIANIDLSSLALQTDHDHDHGHDELGSPGSSGSTLMGIVSSRVITYFSPRIVTSSRIIVSYHAHEKIPFAFAYTIQFAIPLKFDFPHTFPYKRARPFELGFQPPFAVSFELDLTHTLTLERALALLKHMLELNLGFHLALRLPRDLPNYLRYAPATVSGASASNAKERARVSSLSGTGGVGSLGRPVGLTRRGSGSMLGCGGVEQERSGLGAIGGVIGGDGGISAGGGDELGEGQGERVRRRSDDQDRASDGDSDSSIDLHTPLP
ncbi:hypothetical protein BJ138DRAFT_1113213 [Hygrophoropsis aurantiaca]|uniref:Uncharacterized protein n=1 Tax=Hygrophoropsis aurantiaca TaxID=72124 RepID=A0ACB8AEA0_9AGAM|nr:hypothetical protein BJ138DRAFT_1113213 [Hygrophoropsis aurantiaca]